MRALLAGRFAHAVDQIGEITQCATVDDDAGRTQQVFDGGGGRRRVDTDRVPVLQHRCTRIHGSRRFQRDEHITEWCRGAQFDGAAFGSSTPGIRLSVVTAVKLRATMDVTSPTSAPPSFTLARSGRFQRVGEHSVERDTTSGVAARCGRWQVGQSLGCACRACDGCSRQGQQCRGAVSEFGVAHDHRCPHRRKAVQHVRQSKSGPKSSEVFRCCIPIAWKPIMLPDFFDGLGVEEHLVEKQVDAHRPFF